MLKHIDVLALAAIVFAVLAFAKAPQVSFVPKVRTATFRVQNQVEQKNECILSKAITSIFQ